GYTVADHVNAIHTHAGKELIDCCLVNSGRIKPSIFKKYQDDGAGQVMVDLSKMKRMGIRLFERDLVKIERDLVRHDPEKLALSIIEIYKKR
ncbi:MAG: 2-phospho-L-lactate transferase CofD family protein, partial [Clostridia bacterium]|nr:2-phospho-L-lactate transferase CofD family protein [Clostridia bacterium]